MEVPRGTAFPGSLQSQTALVAQAVWALGRGGPRIPPGEADPESGREKSNVGAAESMTLVSRGKQALRCGFCCFPVLGQGPSSSADFRISPVGKELRMGFQEAPP